MCYIVIILHVGTRIFFFLSLSLSQKSDTSMIELSFFHEWNLSTNRKWSFTDTDDKMIDDYFLIRLKIKYITVVAD